MKIGIRLIISFFFVAIVSTGIIGFLSFTQGKESLETEAFNRLTAVREIKASQVETNLQII